MIARLATRAGMIVGVLAALACLAASFIPGSSAGSTSSGGQYI